jgi:Kef-type K+ transport system membrane component KefB
LDLFSLPVYVLVELAIVLVLFTGGLSLDVASLQKYVKLSLISGCGQIVIQCSLFTCIGAVSGLVSGWSVIFFGLVCSFSSTILVSRILSDRNERESLHGQIILAKMVQQDVLAVLALCILPAFKVTIAADSEHVDTHVDGREIGIVFGVLVLVTAILWFLSKSNLLGRIFDFFAADGEMLFIGTTGYAIGLAGLCAIVSPNAAGLGAFFSGVSLSSLPCKLEMQKKCETIRAFGIVFFFFMLGIDLDITVESLKEAIPFSILVSALILFVSPVYLTLIGYISGVGARTAWFTGSICNQMSEFGLILGKLANHIGVFDDRTFQVITLSMLLTFFLSSVGHAHADRIFQLVRPWLLFMDRHSSFGHLEGEELQWRDHVVLLGFNETGLAVSDFYRHKGKDVLMIEMDHFLVSTISALRKKEQDGGSKREGRTEHVNDSPTDVQPVTSRGALALLEHLEAHGLKEPESQHTIPPSLSVGGVQGLVEMDRPTGSRVRDRAPALATKGEGYVVQSATRPHSTPLSSLRKMLSAMDTEQGDFDTSDHVREERVETESVEAGAKVQDKARRSRMKVDEISKSLQELDDVDARIQQLLVTPASRRACQSNSAPLGGAREPGTGMAGAAGGMLEGGGSREKVKKSTSDDRGHVRAEAAGPAEASRVGRGVEGAGGGSGEGEVSVIIVASHFGSAVETREDSAVETREEATDGSLTLNRRGSPVLQASHRRSRTRDSERCVCARACACVRTHQKFLTVFVSVRVRTHACCVCVARGCMPSSHHERDYRLSFFFSPFFVFSLFSNSPRSFFSPFCSVFSLLSFILPPLSCPLSLSALANVWLPVNLTFFLQTRFLFNCISNAIKYPQCDRFGARRLFASANRTYHAESRH